MNTNIQTTFRAAALLLCGAMSVGGLQGRPAPPTTAFPRKRSSLPILISRSRGSQGSV